MGDRQVARAFQKVRVLKVKRLKYYEGHNAVGYGGHPAPAGRALLSLLMRSVFKSQSQKRIGFDFG